MEAVLGLLVCGVLAAVAGSLAGQLVADPNELAGLFRGHTSAMTPGSPANRDPATGSLGRSPHASVAAEGQVEDVDAAAEHRTSVPLERVHPARPSRR